MLQLLSIIFPLLSIIPMKDWQRALSKGPKQEYSPVVFYSQKEAGSNEWLSRNGLLVVRENSPATILFLHGFGNDKFDIAALRLLFKDYSSMAFDFRAHGESTGDQSCTLGHDEVYDVFAAVDFIKSHPKLKNKPVFAYGLSMGAATAIEAQALDSSLFDAMILDAPFMSSEEVIRQGIEKLKFSLLGYNFNIPGRRWLEKYAFNPYVQPVLKWVLKMVASWDSSKIETFIKPILPGESIKNIYIPALFIVCKNDEKISPDSVETIFENHPGFGQLWVTNGRRHCDSVMNNPELYEERVNQFLENVISKQIFDKKKRIIRD